MIKLSEPRTPEEVEAYFDFRWRELRAPWQQPRGSERDEFEDQAFHVTAHTLHGDLVGIGRIHRTADGNAQIRYMATLDTHRGLGIGRAIVGRLEQHARAIDAGEVFLNARRRAIPFYEKLGYEITGVGPTLFGTIEHRRMRKRL